MGGDNRPCHRSSWRSAGFYGLMARSAKIAIFPTPVRSAWKKVSPIPETLVVPREAFFIALKRVFPEIPRPFHDSAPALPNALPLPSLRGWGPSESSLLFIYGAFPFCPPGPRRTSPSPGKKALAVPSLRAWPPPRGDVPTPAQCFSFRRSSTPCRPPSRSGPINFELSSWTTRR